MCSVCHPEEPVDFLRLIKICCDEGSHHYKYEILLKMDLSHYLWVIH